MKRIKFGKVLVFALTVAMGSVSMADSKKKPRIVQRQPQFREQSVVRQWHRILMLESARTVLLCFQVKSSATVASA